MPATTTATTTAKHSAPAIPAARAELAAAITRRRQVEADRDCLRQDIDRGRGLIAEADGEIEGLEAKLKSADVTDNRRAAGLIKADRPVAVPWDGDRVRLGIEQAKKRRESTIRGVAELEAELVESEIAVAMAANDVIVARANLLAPFFAARMTRIKALRLELLKERVLLATMMADNDAPEFPNDGRAFFKAREAEQARLKARDAACGQMRDEAMADAAYFALMPTANSMDEYTLVMEVAAQLKQKLAQLLADPIAELPEKI